MNDFPLYATLIRKSGKTNSFPLVTVLIRANAFILAGLLFTNYGLGSALLLLILPFLYAERFGRVYHIVASFSCLLAMAVLWCAGSRWGCLLPPLTGFTLYLNVPWFGREVI